MLDTLATKQTVAESVLDHPGKVTEIKIRGGRQAMVEKLQQLVTPQASSLSHRMGRGEGKVSRALPADRAVAFIQLAHERINGALVRCEERYPQAGPHSVLVVIVDRDPAQWREKLGSLHTELFGPGKTDPLAPTQLEVLDRATDDAIQRLIAAGLISKTTRASRPLFPIEDDPAAAPLSSEEQAKAKAHRERATRKLKMAHVLGDSGFAEEARPALLEAILSFSCALAVEARLPEPPDANDALTAPLSHQWKDALPAVAEFVRDADADWKAVADSLGAL